MITTVCREQPLGSHWQPSDNEVHHSHWHPASGLWHGNPNLFRFNGLIKASPLVYKERVLLGVECLFSRIPMVLVFVEYQWETSLVFDIALSETVGTLKAQIRAITGKPIGMSNKRGMILILILLTYSTPMSSAY